MALGEAIFGRAAEAGALVAAGAGGAAGALAVSAVPTYNRSIGAFSSGGGGGGGGASASWRTRALRSQKRATATATARHRYHRWLAGVDRRGVGAGAAASVPEVSVDDVRAAADVDALD